MWNRLEMYLLFLPLFYSYELLCVGLQPNKLIEYIEICNNG